MQRNDLLTAAMQFDGVERSVFQQLWSVLHSGEWVNVYDIDRFLQLPTQERTHYLYAAKQCGLVCRKGISHNKFQHVRIVAVRANNPDRWPAILRGE